MLERYYRDKETNEIHWLRIEQDEDPLNPRYDWDGQIGKMMCWYSGYSLGDYKENHYKTPEDFLNDLVRNRISEKTIINYVKNGRTSNELELKYNRSENVWELWGYYKYWWTGNEVHHGVIESNYPIDFLIDDIIEAMSFDDKWKLLEKHAGIVYLPLYVYEHSGITMNTGGYSCKWDSSQVGWIYTDKKTIMECGGMMQNEKGNFVKITDRNWKKAAYLWMEGEVEEYDMYLTGEVYGYIDTNLSTGEEDSCWGFFSEKWGDELLEELALECGITEDNSEWIPKEEAVA